MSLFKVSVVKTSYIKARIDSIFLRYVLKQTGNFPNAKKIRKAVTK